MGAIHHPRSAKANEKFSFEDPGTILHAVTYGMDPMGADTFLNLQHGGVVTVLYAIVDGELYFGLIRQRRSSRIVPGVDDGFLWQHPRGNLDPGKDVQYTADTEVSEEVGAFGTKKSVRVPGESAVMDSAWYRMFLGDQASNGGSGFKGIDVFALEVSPGLLEPDSEEKGTFRFRSGVLKPRTDEGLDPNRALPEYIVGSRFFSWSRAVGFPCGFTAFGAGRVLAYLVQEKRLLMRFVTLVSLPGTT